MKHPQKRVIHFHGIFKEKYQEAPLEIHADSMFNLFNILTRSAYPSLLEEKRLNIAFEDNEGNITDLFDPEQTLSPTQKVVHIYPSTEGSDGGLSAAIISIIVAIVSVGVALLLAPKLDVDQDTTSGSNFSSAENVVGQGGTMPVILGKRRTGSRVASFGIDTKAYRSRSQ